MSQTECNPIKVAHEYLAEFPLTHLSYRRPVVSETDTVWTVRYELPPDWPGFGLTTSSISTSGPARSYTRTWSSEHWRRTLAALTGDTEKSHARLANARHHRSCGDVPTDGEPNHVTDQMQPP